MKKCLIRMILLFLFASNSIGIEAQTMNVKEMDGANSSFALDDIRKVTFSGDSISIFKLEGEKSKLKLDDVSRIDFKYLVTELIPHGLAKPIINVFPNPIDHELSILWTNISAEKMLIEIISLEGKSVHLETDNWVVEKGIKRINLKDLSPGLYVLKLHLGNLIETHKIIKR